VEFWQGEAARLLKSRLLISVCVCASSIRGSVSFMGNLKVTSSSPGPKMNVVVRQVKLERFSILEGSTLGRLIRKSVE
jgi:hypothetical protein